MSTHTGTTTPPSREVRHEDPERAAGWLLFAGAMVMIAGFLNLIYGSPGSATPTGWKLTRRTCSAI